MKILPLPTNTRSQTAIEYLLLFTVVAVIVFASFKSLVPRAQQVSNTYYNKVAIGIMGEPPPKFIADFSTHCVAYPLEHPPVQYASCSDPVYPYEFVHYTTGDAACGGDDGANVTICCDQSFPTISVISSPVQCGFFSFPPPAACSGTYSHQLFAWCSENCDHDDAYTRFCIKPEDADSIPNFWVSTGNQGTHPGCAGGTELVSWCEGNCDADDAANTICYGS